MPVVRIREEANGVKLGVWQITESQDELTAAASEQGLDTSYCGQFKTPYRNAQCLAVRLLLAELLGKREVKLFYDEFGKPHLQNGPHVSISHSKKMVAVIVDPQASTGIDIEFFSEKVKRIGSRFLHERELITIDAAHETAHLLLFWGGKEAMYKAYGKKELIFKEQLYIPAFRYAESGVFKGEVRLGQRHQCFTLKHEKIDNYTLVYLLNS
jgi:phosphopantetheinyl transferase